MSADSKEHVAEKVANHLTGEVILRVNAIDLEDQASRLHDMQNVLYRAATVMEQLSFGDQDKVFSEAVLSLAKTEVLNCADGCAEDAVNYCEGMVSNSMKTTDEFVPIPSMGEANVND